MHIQNLSIVFGPTLMWPHPDSLIKSNLPTSQPSNDSSNGQLINDKLLLGLNGSLVNGMIEQMKSNKVVEFLLTEFNSLFSRS